MKAEQKLDTNSLYENEDSSDDEEFDQIVQLDTLMQEINVAN